ncbi:hypothetical protein ACFL1H_02285 [Nanoarchaeota archaeon]
MSLENKLSYDEIKFEKHNDKGIITTPYGILSLPKKQTDYFEKVYSAGFNNFISPRELNPKNTYHQGIMSMNFKLKKIGLHIKKKLKVGYALTISDNINNLKKTPENTIQYDDIILIKINNKIKVETIKGIIEINKFENVIFETLYSVGFNTHINSKEFEGIKKLQVSQYIKTLRHKLKKIGLSVKSTPEGYALVEYDHLDLIEFL